MKFKKKNGLEFCYSETLCKNVKILYNQKEEDFG